MLDIIMADGISEYAFLNDMRARAGAVNDGITSTVSEILNDISKNGISAVNKYSMRFDGCNPYEISKKQVQDAYDMCPKELIAALLKAHENIREYHVQMLAKSWESERTPGARIGQRVMGLNRVGVYVPGGTAAYPSSVLMNIVPAKVAGVREIIMVTPPTENLNNAVLAAAKIAGADRIFALGGVQAIGALAFGAGDIPKVDKIVGPGNAYVAAAKRTVFGSVDIDMIAGPSEILVIADESANPVYIAADLLSQAEHDTLASAMLFTTSKELAEAVKREIEVQINSRTRRDIIEASLRGFGAIIVFKNMESLYPLADEVAPEHLEIITKNPRADMERIRNAGAIFLGEYSPEPLGDYMAGP
ncbi:MAG: histidinol dehydrogenase, partial [Clostridia bacterium]